MHLHAVFLLILLLALKLSNATDSVKDPKEATALDAKTSNYIMKIKPRNVADRTKNKMRKTRGGTTVPSTAISPYSSPGYLFGAYLLPSKTRFHVFGIPPLTTTPINELNTNIHNAITVDTFNPAIVSEEWTKVRQSKKPPKTTKKERRCNDTDPEPAPTAVLLKQAIITSTLNPLITVSEKPSEIPTTTEAPPAKQRSGMNNYMSRKVSKPPPFRTTRKYLFGAYWITTGVFGIPPREFEYIGKVTDEKPTTSKINSVKQDNAVSSKNIQNKKPNNSNAKRPIPTSPMKISIKISRNITDKVAMENPQPAIEPYAIAIRRNIPYNLVPVPTPGIIQPIPIGVRKRPLAVNQPIAAHRLKKASLKSGTTMQPYLKRRTTAAAHKTPSLLKISIDVFPKPHYRSATARPVFELSHSQRKATSTLIRSQPIRTVSDLQLPSLKQKSNVAVMGKMLRTRFSDIQRNRLRYQFGPVRYRNQLKKKKIITTASPKTTTIDPGQVVIVTTVVTPVLVRYPCIGAPTKVLAKVEDVPYQTCGPPPYHRFFYNVLENKCWRQQRNCTSQFRKLFNTKKECQAECILKEKLPHARSPFSMDANRRAMLEFMRTHNYL